jgi:hypothetical protein
MLFFDLSLAHRQATDRAGQINDALVDTREGNCPPPVFRPVRLRGQSLAASRF